MEEQEYSDEIQSTVDDNEEDDVSEVTGIVPKSRIVCKRMFVTSNTGIMILLWTMTTMVFSGNSFYWYLTTVPYFQHSDQVVSVLFPFSAVCALLLLLYPVLALLGDCFPGQLWPIVIASALPNLIGLIIVLVLVSTVGEPYLTLIVGFGLMLLSCGVFKANVIPYARDAIPNPTPSNLSTFLHWYYWATYAPCLLMAVWFGAYQIDADPRIKVADFIAMPAIGLLIISALGLTCFIRQCRRGCWRFKRVPRPSHNNPIKQVGHVTWTALRRRRSRSTISGLDRAKLSHGGAYEDERVDDVKRFWHVFFTLLSLFGFCFWDDLRSTTFAHSVLYDDPLAFGKPSAQVMAVIIVFVGIPVYQILIRPFAGNQLPSATVRIMLGMMLEFLTAVLLIGINGWLEAQMASNSTLNQSLCAMTTNDTQLEAANSTANSTAAYLSPPKSNYLLLYIPQATNGVSQMLVFIGVFELILSRAPRKMHGLLIGIWYAIQSLHPIVRVIGLASCAVFHWEYYVFKAVMVFVSTIAYAAAATLCFRKRQHPRIKYQVLTDTT